MVVPWIPWQCHWVIRSRQGSRLDTQLAGKACDRSNAAANVASWRGRPYAALGSGLTRTVWTKKDHVTDVPHGSRETCRLRVDARRHEARD